MDIAANAFNLQNLVDHALTTFQKNNPRVAFLMDWRNVHVKMSNHQKRSIGLCKFQRSTGCITLSFSASAFASATEAERQGVVSHEMAHAVCFRLDCGDSHDARWANICKQMGGDGERFFKGNVTVKRNLVKRWICAKSDGNPAGKSYMRTKRQATNFMRVYPDGVTLGVISIDANSKTYKWIQWNLKPTTPKPKIMGAPWNVVA